MNGSSMLFQNAVATSKVCVNQEPDVIAGDRGPAEFRLIMFENIAQLEAKLHPTCARKQILAFEHGARSRAELHVRAPRNAAARDMRIHHETHSASGTPVLAEAVIRQQFDRVTAESQTAIAAVTGVEVIACRDLHGNRPAPVIHAGIDIAQAAGMNVARVAVYILDVGQRGPAKGQTETYQRIKGGCFLGATCTRPGSKPEGQGRE